MSSLRLLSFLSLISVVAISAGSLASNSPALPISEKVCSSTLDASAAEFSIALKTMAGLDSVLHALNKARFEIQEPEYCVSGVALSRNIYQYVKYLFLVEVREKGQEKARFQFHFLFQSASIQSYHNMNGQPWTGLQQSDVQNTFDAMLKGAQFQKLGKEANEMSLLEIAQKSATFASTQAEFDHNSLSVIRISEKDSKSGADQAYLVSWMTLPSVNPFTSSTRTLGVLISRNADGSTSLSEKVLVVRELLFPLEDLLHDKGHQLGTRETWADQLLEDARTQH